MYQIVHVYYVALKIHKKSCHLANVIQIENMTTYIQALHFAFGVTGMSGYYKMEFPHVF